MVSLSWKVLMTNFGSRQCRFGWDTSALGVEGKRAVAFWAESVTGRLRSR